MNNNTSLTGNQFIYNKKMNSNVLSNMGGPYYSRNSLKSVSLHCKNNGAVQVSFKGTETLLNIQEVALRWLNKFPIKISQYDTPAIKKARQECLDCAHNFPKTSTLNSPEREKMRSEIITNYFKKQANVNRDKNFYLVVGLPGCGKSTLSDAIAIEHKAFNLNQDDIRSEIPEFKKNKRFEYVVLEEASKMRNQILDSAIDKDYDIVLENIGIYKDEVTRLLDKVKSKGYKIHFIMVDLPVDKAAQRLVKRFEEIDKFVDPLIHSLFPKAPLKNYKDLVDTKPGYFSSYALYSSDVPRGEPFKLVSKSK